MHHKTIAELSQDLATKKISSTELTKLFLERIKRFDEKLNSYITVTE
jgi:aspartyl-tRNA(Asn)/glutamyl-tRNA(Gln) amidotransferase subunit A